MQVILKKTTTTTTKTKNKKQKKKPTTTTQKENKTKQKNLRNQFTEISYGELERVFFCFFFVLFFCFFVFIIIIFFISNSRLFVFSNWSVYTRHPDAWFFNDHPPKQWVLYSLLQSASTSPECGLSYKTHQSGSTLHLKQVIFSKTKQNKNKNKNKTKRNKTKQPKKKKS